MYKFTVQRTPGKTHLIADALPGLEIDTAISCLSTTSHSSLDTIFSSIDDVSVQIQSDFISRRNRIYIQSSRFPPTFKIIVACMSSKLEKSERRKGERNSFLA